MRSPPPLPPIPPNWLSQADNVHEDSSAPSHRRSAAWRSASKLSTSASDSRLQQDASLTSFLPAVEVPSWMHGKPSLSGTRSGTSKTSLPIDVVQAPAPDRSLWMQNVNSSDKPCSTLFRSTSQSVVAQQDSAAERRIHSLGQTSRYLHEQQHVATRLFDKCIDEREEDADVAAKKRERILHLESELSNLRRERKMQEHECLLIQAHAAKADGQIRSLGEQNKQLKRKVEQEKANNNSLEITLHTQGCENRRLQQLVSGLESLKNTGNVQIAEALAEISKSEAILQATRAEGAQLEEANQLLQAQGRSAVESLKTKLKEAEQHNVEQLKQIQHNEVREHSALEHLRRLNDTIIELTARQKELRERLRVGSQQSDSTVLTEAHAEIRRKVLETTIDHLQASLRSTEESNEKLQNKLRQSVEDSKEGDGKVALLMDQVRRAQMALQKQEQLGADRLRRNSELSADSDLQQDTFASTASDNMEAQEAARQAVHMENLMMNKNTILQASLRLACESRAHAEQKLLDLKERGDALEEQNDYWSKKIDGNEEDKIALRCELRRIEDEFEHASVSSVHMKQRKSALEETARQLEIDRATIESEIDFIKQEDMLDEYGRVKPILIDSECDLVDRLELNEFLLSAQRARNPIPLLIEKLSCILEMVHTTESQAHMYSEYLLDSERMLTSLRHKNNILEGKVKANKTWQMRALLNVVTNAFGVRPPVDVHDGKRFGKHTLYLDSMELSTKELEELHHVIQQLGKENEVRFYRLRCNQFNGTTVPVLCRLIELCPYLELLDLQGNCLIEVDAHALQECLERLDRFTNVTGDYDSGTITAMTDGQVRLTIDLRNQNMPPARDLVRDHVDVGMEHHEYATVAERPGLASLRDTLDHNFYDSNVSLSPAADLATPPDMTWSSIEKHTAPQWEFASPSSGRSTCAPFTPAASAGDASSRSVSMLGETSVNLGTNSKPVHFSQLYAVSTPTPSSISSSSGSPRRVQP